MESYLVCQLKETDSSMIVGVTNGRRYTWILHGLLALTTLFFPQLEVAAKVKAPDPFALESKLDTLSNNTGYTLDMFSKAYHSTAKVKVVVENHLPLADGQ